MTEWFAVRKKPVVVMARGPIQVEETIETLEGTHHASVGDFIIRGVKGEVYPIKPEIFEATYEPVEHNHGQSSLCTTICPMFEVET